MGTARARRRLAWLFGGAALGAGVVLMLALGPNTDPPPERRSTVPAQEPERQVAAPLPQEARRVAVRFIQTAVARATTYRYSSPTAVETVLPAEQGSHRHPPATAPPLA